jgi:hypothetical protein
MNFTDDGMTISVNRVLENAPLSICDNLELDSNVTDESKLHLKKQRSPKISTDDGITIFVNPLSLNAPLAIRDKLEDD